MFVFNQCEIPNITNQMSGLSPCLFHYFLPNSEMYLLGVLENDCEPSIHHRDLGKPAKQQKWWKQIVSL